MGNANPILNNPYAAPRRHYATNPAGELNYEDVRAGRRPFTGELQTIPVRQVQGELITVQELEDEYGALLVNRLRLEVQRWREESWPQTTRITRCSNSGSRTRSAPSASNSSLRSAKPSRRRSG